MPASNAETLDSTVGPTETNPNPNPPHNPPNVPPQPAPEHEDGDEGDEGDGDHQDEKDHVGEMTLTLEQIPDTSNEDLLKFYNQHVKKQREYFPDRPTAERLVMRVINKMKGTEPAPEPVPLTPEQLADRDAQIKINRSEGTRRSWSDEAVRIKRANRTGVEVDGVYYSSVNQAYKTLGLDVRKHIQHRSELKQMPAGTKDEEYGMIWEIVPYRKTQANKPEVDLANETDEGPSLAAE
jgi:hypothetical protein